jgi:hypothetical protein
MDLSFCDSWTLINSPNQNGSDRIEDTAAPSGTVSGLAATAHYPNKYTVTLFCFLPRQWHAGPESVWAQSSATKAGPNTWRGPYFDPPAHCCRGRSQQQPNEPGGHGMEGSLVLLYVPSAMGSMAAELCWAHVSRMLKILLICTLFLLSPFFFLYNREINLLCWGYSM